MKSSNVFIVKYLQKLPLWILFLLVIFSGALYLFTDIMHEVLLKQEISTDNAVFNFLSAHVINDQLTGIMKVITNFAAAQVLQIGYGTIILFYLLNKNWKRSIEIVAIGLGGFIVNYFMKMSFQRVRPPGPLIEKLNNFSFPSGHATSAFIFYGLIGYLVWKTDIKKTYKILIATVLILFSFLIAFSRVYLRVHYPSDVIAGICIGFSWLVLTIWIFENIKKRSDEELTGKREPTTI
jgi:membrane-associated phospholipid phosphatase